MVPVETVAVDTELEPEAFILVQLKNKTEFLPFGSRAKMVTIKWFCHCVPALVMSPSQLQDATSGFCRKTEKRPSS